MADIFNIPKINPVKFYPLREAFTSELSPTPFKEKVDNMQFNSLYMDDDFQFNLIKDYIQARQWAKPFQVDDVISVQWEGIDTTAATYQVIVVNEYGTIIKQFDSTTSGAWVISGGRKIFQFALPLWDIEEGYYCIMLKKVGTFSNSDFAVISEPLDIREYHPKTILHKYKHSSNDYGIYFDTNICFQIRLPAVISELNPNSRFSVYENQPLDLEMLGGISYREWMYNTDKLPEYVIDQMEAITLCDDITYDGKAFTRTDGSKFEPQDNKLSILKMSKITLREKDNDHALIITNTNKIVLGEMPTTDVFFVSEITISSIPSTITIQKYFKGVRRFLAYMNNVVAEYYLTTSNTSYYGVNKAGSIVFYTTDTATYTVMEGAIFGPILPYWISVKVRKNGALEDVEIENNNVVAVGGSYAFLDEENTLIDYDTFVGSYILTATAVGEKTYYLFFDSSEGISLENTENIISEIGGQLEPDTVSFICTNNTLKKVNNDLTSHCGGALELIDLSNNNLSTNMISTVLRQVYECNVRNGLNTSAFTLELTSNNPPTVESSIFTSALVDDGAIINVD